jgi:AraC family transcriptional regulator
MIRSAKRSPQILFSDHYSITYSRDKQYSFTSDGQTDFRLIHVLSGAARFTIDSRTQEIAAGQFVLLNPALSYKLQGVAARLLLLTMSPAFVIDCAVRTGLGGTSNSVVLKAGEVLQNKSITRLARELSSEITRIEKGHEAVIAALMEQLIIHLLRHYSSVRRSDNLELSRVGLIDRRIRRALELMHAQIDQELSLKELAAASYLSTFHFARLFKKLTGTSPHAYLASLRATTAQKLLAETDLSINEIGGRVGYTNPSHFSKAFRQVTGLTPRAFRKSLVPTRS